MTAKTSDFDVTDCPYLVRNGINLPSKLVAEAIARGDIKLPPPPTTIPRCPVGKKAAAERERQEHEQMKRERPMSIIAPAGYHPTSQLYGSAASFPAH